MKDTKLILKILDWDGTEMCYFELFIVFVARWYRKVSLQFLCRFLGRLSWAASQTLDNFVFSRFHLNVSVFVRIVIVFRGIRIQSPFRHRTLGTSFSPYAIFHRRIGFRDFSSLRNQYAKIQINKKRIKWKTQNTKYLFVVSSSSELLSELLEEELPEEVSSSSSRGRRRWAPTVE